VGPWTDALETIWIPLRYEVLKLYELIEQENPKLYGLAIAIDRIKKEYPLAEIIVRPPSEAAGRAMESDLIDFGIKFDPEARKLRWLPLATRMPWSSGQLIEVFSGAVAPWWHTLLWSAESNLRYHLTYPFEVRMMSAAASADTAKHKGQVAEAF